MISPIYSKLAPIAFDMFYTPALKGYGVIPEQRYSKSTFMTYRCRMNCKPVVAKMISSRHNDLCAQLENESHLLRCLQSTPNTPYLILHERDIPAGNITYFINLFRDGRFAGEKVDILVREHIEGEELRPEEMIADPLEKDMLFGIINMAHGAGYSGIGIRNRRNYIRNSQGKLHFIDLGAAAHASDRQRYKEFCQRDWIEFESICGKD